MSEDTVIEDCGDLVSIDSIYYPGVHEFILKYLTEYPERVAHVIINTYTKQDGIYELDFDEG